MPSVQSFNTVRARSYVSRLPLFTRIIVVIIFAFWAAGFQSVLDLQKWGALIPDQISITAAYRLSTFPLIHLNFIHALLNVLALTPLMERFEAEYGTLTTLALFFGPLTTIPGVLYVVIERAILRANSEVVGASLWVFLLLGMEAIRTYKTNPYLVIGTVHIPTWTTPLLLILVVAALVPRTSFLGHLCGVIVGYAAGFGYVKFLAPPEWALRWIESRLNLLAILPHYVSVDQKTYGRFGVLPSNNRTGPGGSAATELVGTTQRLGP
ncbi:rhomboid family protein [Ilyonectria robusta]|uniref:rhomboid family protein n=1 Tax=Ilyonectria robusta TaxID=1079257 RepID=UPI001E8D2ABB|nr:rhomboid family protein [Ilyonectria robusta]KAH6989447.1 rhomboid family protein [Ilyonectria sp. MPI-CAGE-AT-0026]KAH8670470.1 rhomboid family protein [Ilyonectria robusta]